MSYAPSSIQVWHKAFFRWVRAHSHTPTHVRQSQKCWHFPKEGCLKCQAINLTPPMKVKAWGDGPLRLEELNHLTRMPDSPLKSLGMKQWLIKQYLTNVPPDGRVWHKAFFRWVRAQGCGPDTSGGPKNTLGPVSIPLKRVPQVPGNKSNLSKEG